MGHMLEFDINELNMAKQCLAPPSQQCGCLALELGATIMYPLIAHFRVQSANAKCGLDGLYFYFVLLVSVCGV